MSEINEINFTSEARNSCLIDVRGDLKKRGQPIQAEFVEDIVGFDSKFYKIGFRLREEPRRVRPLRDDSALYANFSDIFPYLWKPGFGKIIQNFANRFGPLFPTDAPKKLKDPDISHGQIVRISKNDAGRLLIYNFRVAKEYIHNLEQKNEGVSSVHGEVYYIENIIDWGNAILDFNIIREIWTIIQSEDVSYFRHILDLDWTKGPRSRWTEYKADLYYYRLDDKKLLTSAKESLLRNLEDRLLGSFSVGFEGTRFILKPSCLLVGMYLQFASAVTGFDEGAFIRRCHVCSTWFEISPRAGRPEKKYCSDACRMRAYRTRNSKTGSEKTSPASDKS